VARPLVTVVGLGPGPAGLVTRETLDAIASAKSRFLRTRHHPSASLVGDAVSFDDEYERHDTFAEVYAAIAERVATAALRDGSALYAVPGSPGVLEDGVRRLCADERIEVRVLAAVSFLDLAWLRLGIDPVDSAVKLVDAHQFAQAAAGEAGPFLIAQCHADWVLSEVKLAHESANGDEAATVLHHLGLPDERVVSVAWRDLDRLAREHGVEADHLTSLYVPRLSEQVAGEMARLHRLARTLLEQCPWDREQTHASLAKHLIEEAWELHDAITALDTASEAERPRAIADLAEELGDVLLQVVLHSQIAQERGDFDLAAVHDGLVRKIVRRHPHVFGEASATTSRDVQRNWEAIKAGERTAAGEGEKRKGALDGVSRGLPALSASRELQDRASAVGYDWPTLDGVRAKISEELTDLDEALAEAGHPDQITSTPAASAAPLVHAQEELGDVLAAIVNLGRRSGIDAEAALRGANDKFRRRFAEVERRAALRGISLKDADFTTLDALWDEAKAAEREVKG